MQSIRLGTAILATLVSFSAIAADIAPLHKSEGVLVDSSGMTVYTFDKDQPDSGKSACTDACANNWPPVVAGDAALPAPYSAIKREDGTKQLAYKGKPLYTFVKDKKAGDKNGDKVKDMWHVVTE